MSAGIAISNDGQAITSTNYWQSEYARRGILYLSINAGAVRLLIPHGNSIGAALVDAARTARECIITRGLYNNSDAYELLYEDDTDTPFSAIFGLEQADRLIPASEHDRQINHTIWTRGFRDTPTLAVTLPGRFRTARTLPYLKAWGK